MLFTSAEIDLLHSDLCPLGRVPVITSDGITYSETTSRRFIFDTSLVPRAMKTKKLMSAKRFNPQYVSVGINEAISRLIPTSFDLYQKMFTLLGQLDAEVRKSVSSCSQAAVLFGSRQFGEQLFPHIHQAADEKLPSLSIFVRLSNNDSTRPKLIFYGEHDDSSDIIERGYTNHKLLRVLARRYESIEFEVEHLHQIAFNASHIPHAFSYTNDLWMVLVYDNAAFNQAPELNVVRPLFL